MKTNSFSKTIQLSERTAKINFKLTKLLDGMSEMEKQSLIDYITKVRSERLETQINNKDNNFNKTALLQEPEKSNKIINLENYRDKIKGEQGKKMANCLTDNQGIIMGFKTREEQKNDEKIDYFLKTNRHGEQAYNWKKINEKRRANINNPNYPIVFWIKWMNLTALYIKIDCQEYVMDPIEALDIFGDNPLFLNELLFLINSPLNHLYSEKQKLIFKKKVMERR